MKLTDCFTYDAIGNPLNDGERTYTWGAGRQLRHISMRTGEAHGVRFSNGEHAESGTLLRIVRSGSVLSAKVFRGEREITDECAASAFVWTKNGSPLASAVKQVSVSDEEISGDALFSCAYTETQDVYGSVSVDNNLVASHIPATADANHEFTLENGMLKVNIPNSAGNGTDYELTDGVLSVNPGFTGTITAEYEFTTNPTREIDFEYDHNGLRTRKKVVENGVTTTYDYTLHGKLITHLTKRVATETGAETIEALHFFYDAQSRPAFLEYNGEMYRYIHNLQGDIVAIVDSAGNKVVEYKYDAWGKIISATGSLKTTLSELNLFRYRGYVYDEEIYLYYLENRYYVAESGRMLNADDLLGKVGPGFSHNAFSYRVNNPVTKHDPDGRYAISATLIGAGVAIGVALLVIAGRIADKSVSTKTHVKKEPSFKESISIVAFTVDLLYFGIQDNIKEWASEREKVIAITRQYRVEGAPHFYATLTGNGIWVVGDPMTFEAAFSAAIQGENVWTANQLDMYALACAVGTYSGYGVTEPDQGKRYFECWHYRLVRGNQKHPTHFFYGYENVEFL